MSHNNVSDPAESLAEPMSEKPERTISNTPTESEHAVEQPLTPVQASKQGLEENLRRFLSFLGVGEKEFVELAGLGGKQIYVGGARGYEDIIELARQGGLLTDGRGDRPIHGLYVVVNKPVAALGGRYVPDLWHQGIDRVKDREIERRRVLYIDLDPVRMHGTSSTAREMRAATKAARAVVATLKRYATSRDAIGFGLSGNGFQVHLAIDVPNTPEVELTIKRMLAIMSAIHGGDHGYGHQVEVDTTVGNAARLAPAFGTLKCKGHDNSDEEQEQEQKRPHRRSWFWCGPDTTRLSEQELTCLVQAMDADLTPEQRARLDVTKKVEPPYQTGTKPGPERDQDSVIAVAKRHPCRDVAEWLGILDRDGTVQCPGCGETKGVAILEGPNRFKCLHSRCASKGRQNGCRSNIDLVIEVRGYPGTPESIPRAAEEICQHFGLGYKAISKSRGKARIPSDARLVSMSILESSCLVGITIDQHETAQNPAEGTDATDGSPPESKQRNLTDLGNAERLRDRYGEKIRYVTSWQKWIVWDGQRWVEDTGSLMVAALANQTIRSIYLEAGQEQDPVLKAQLFAWATKSEADQRLSAMVRRATTLPCLHIDHNLLDADPYLINTPTGILNLKTGQAGPHDRSQYCTKLTRVPYDPTADRSIFELAFAKSLPDPTVRNYVLKLLGKSLTANTEDHILPIHYSSRGRNGKDTFMGSLMVLMGDYADEVPFEVLEQTQNSGHPTGLSLLYGKRFILSSETGKGDALNVKLAKRLTGENKIQTRKMQQDFWGFLPTHTLHLATNHKMRIQADPKDPIWERVALIEWAHIPPAERDPALKAKLRGVGARGFFAAIVNACLAWQREGLDQPESVKVDTTSYRDESDQLGSFIDDHLIHESGQEVTLERVHEAYQEWATNQGLRHPLARNGLARELNERDIGQPGRDKSNRSIRIGIRLRTRQDDPGRQDTASLLEFEDLDDFSGPEWTRGHKPEPELTPAEMLALLENM